MRSSHKVVATLSAVACAGFAGAGAASAAPGGLSGVHFASVLGSSRAPLVNSVSHGFAGWVFGKPAAGMTVRFKIPKLTCTSALRGVGPGAFMLTGPKTAPKTNGAGVLLECFNGAPAAAADVIVNNTETLDTTHSLFVGDLMKAVVTTSATVTKATVSDLTSGHTFTFTKSGTGAASLEELIIDDSLVNSSNQQLPVANFGTITYGMAAVGGVAIGNVTPQTAYDMRTSTNVLQIQTGAILTTAKNTFNTFWKHV